MKMGYDMGYDMGYYGIWPMAYGPMGDDDGGGNGGDGCDGGDGDGDDGHECDYSTNGQMVLVLEVADLQKSQCRRT
jgi:hypothetical protein